MLKFKVKHRHLFKKQIKQRIAALQQVPALRATLSVPALPEWSWWYYQEFGTATQFAPVQDARSATMLPPSTAPGGYRIRPRNKAFLVWPWDGRNVFITPEVGPPYTDLHPGVPPKRSIRLVEPDIQREAGQLLHEALVAGAMKNPSSLMTPLLEALVFARQAIADSMNRSHTPEPIMWEMGLNHSKLNGKKAGDVFRAGARIEK